MTKIEKCQIRTKDTNMQITILKSENLRYNSIVKNKTNLREKDSNMNSLIKMLSNSKKFNSYLQELKNKKSPVMLTGLTDVSKIYFAYASKEYIGRKICFITYNEIQARKIVKDFEFFSDKVVFVPKKEIVTYDYVVESKDLPYERMDALNKIYKEEADIIVITIEAILQEMISKELLYKYMLDFKVGKTYDLEQVKQSLINLGYTRCDLIEAKGQFSLRGGILDVALTNQKGIRIEFWGDEVDSIRYFKIATQRSVEMLKEITIYPAHEFVLEQDIDSVCNKIKQRGEFDTYKEQVQQDIELIKKGNYISKIDKYFHSFYSKVGNLLEYITDEYDIFFDEPGKIKARANNLKIDNENVQAMLVEKEKIIPDVIKSKKEYEEVLFEIQKKQMICLEKQDVRLNR